MSRYTAASTATSPAARLPLLAVACCVGVVLLTGCSPDARRGERVPQVERAAEARPLQSDDDVDRSRLDCACLANSARPRIVWDPATTDDTLQLTDGTVIDARGVTFRVRQRRDGILLRAAAPVDNVCFVGGDIRGPFDPHTWMDWQAAKVVYGLRFEDLGTAKVCGLSVANVGDGVKIRGSRGSYHLIGCYFKGCMDDAIECDDLLSCTIDDVLIEGAHVCFAFRPHKDVALAANGGGNLISIRNTLAALAPQRAVYKGSSPGHGGFIKYSTNPDSSRRPRLELRNNIWMATQDANYNSLSLNPLGDVVVSENNTIIWLGEGDYPTPIPAGWTVSRDKSLWDEAVRLWKRRHPHFDFEKPPTLKDET